jgi:protein-S-isoprenylcysteine O-methyltransferase Ste14
MAVELLFLPVPSEASTLQIFRPTEATAGDPLARARARPRGAKVILYLLPVAVNVVLFCLPLLAVLWPPLAAYLTPAGGIGPGLEISAAILMVVGSLLTLRAVVEIRGRRLSADPIAPAGLRVTGLFRYSRNPGLLGNFLLYGGLLLAFPSPPVAVGWVLYVVHMHHRVRLEEGHLLARFGAPYRRYLETVPRYIGWRRGSPTDGATDR